MSASLVNERAEPMDLAAIVYAFVLTIGGSQFVINDYVEINPGVMEVDVQTLNAREDKRYILLLENGHIIQHVRVPLVASECKNPH